MKVITDKEYVRDCIYKRLLNMMGKLNEARDVSIDRKYIGTKVVKELEEAELTDNEVVNLYNACNYDKFVNLVEALESADVLDCGNTNEMIRKLTVIIWCHYENSVDTSIMDSIDNNIMTTLNDIAVHLKIQEDKENRDDTTLEPGFDTDDFDDEFVDSLFCSNPFEDITKEDNNIKENSDKQKEIKKAYKKLEKALDTLKDIVDGD